MFVGLTCAPAVKVGGYSLEQDDSCNFTIKHHYVHRDRAFPKEKYPKGAFSSDPVASISAAEPEPESLPQLPGQSKEMLIQMHRHLVKMAAAMGIQDLCTEDKATRPENILERISKKNLVCQFCDKKLSSVTHLKTHIRSLHLRKTAHKCEQCNKYFSEASTLARHLPSHDKEAPKFRCDKKIKRKKEGGEDDDMEEVECGREFITYSKLIDHQDVHIATKLPCQFCKKLVAKRQRGVKEHEDTCTSNPARKGLVKCRLCQKEFSKRNSMLRHFKKAHPGQNPDM